MPSGSAAPNASGGPQPASRLGAQLAWLPWMIAALAVAAQPLWGQWGRDPTVGGTGPPPPAAAPLPPRCRLPLYHLMDKHPSLGWIYSNVMREVYPGCRCALEIRGMDAFLAAAPAELARSVLLVDNLASAGVRGKVSDLINAGVAGSMGVFHITDEQRLQDTLWYQSFSFVYRHYWREGKDSLGHLLPASANASAASPFWFPVGYGNQFMPSAAFQAKSLAARSKLWFFSGDLLGKPDRQRFVDGVKAHPQAARVEELGHLRTYQGFGGYGRWDALDPWHYSVALYDAAFAPSPTGSGESLRMWEALEAGAVPVLPDDPQFAHLEPLGLHVPKLKSWEDFGNFALRSSTAEALEEWERRRWGLLQRYEEIKTLLRAHVAQKVCALADAAA